jgi:iron complex outermembrane receptor protein
MRGTRSIVLLLAGVAGSALLPACAAAAETNAVEEIIVTAEKREARLQRVPVAVSAYDDAALERAHIDTVAGLQTLDPSLQFNAIDGAALISIRGIGTLVLGPGEDPGVAVHLDGVYLGRAQYHAAALYDVARVEVLRGPQGTVNGRNATGGAINIITQRPTMDPQGYATVEIGNYSSVKTSGAFGGPISGDSLLGRIAWRTENHDGYTPNRFTGGSLDAANQQSLRGSLLARLSDKAELVLTLDTDRMDTDGFANVVLGTTTGLPLPGIALGGVAATGRAVSADAPSYYRRDINGASARLSVDFDGFSLTSVTGYREMSERVGADIDGTSADFVRAAYRREQWQASQEVNLASDNDGPLKWLVGLYYLHEDQDSNETYGFPTIGFVLSIGGQPTTDSYAAYAQASYDLTHALTVTGGLRYTRDRKKAAEHQLIPEFGVNARADLAGEWDALTPKVSIDYRPSDTVMLYGSVSRGFRSGGFNLGGLQGRAFEPEFVWSYEAGVKAQFLDRRLTTNVAVFRADYTDMQVFQIRALTATVENAASATLSGAELEVTALLGKGLRVDFAGSYLDATFNEFESIDESRSELGLIDLSGNQLPRAPKSKFNIAVEKRWEVGDGRALTGRVGYHWTDRVYFSEFNRAILSQAAVGVWNGLLTYQSGQYRISAFAENITDETIYSNKLIGAGLLGFNILASAAPPRTYGVEVGVTF